MVGGSHALHQHEKLAIALSKAMRGHSLQETKKDGRFHVHTRTYLDGAILKEVVFLCHSYDCFFGYSTAQFYELGFGYPIDKMALIIAIIIFFLTPI